MVLLKVLAMAVMLWGCGGGGGVPPRTGISLPKRPLSAETDSPRHQASVKLNVTPTDEWKRAKVALLAGSRKDLNTWLAPGNLAFKAIYWLDIDEPSVGIAAVAGVWIDQEVPAHGLTRLASFGDTAPAGRSAPGALAQCAQAPWPWRAPDTLGEGRRPLPSRSAKGNQP
jgi:hypothetical protein